MKTFMRLTSFVLFAIIYLSSCQKKPVVTPPKEQPGCNLLFYRAFTTGYFRFTYNAAGNPVSSPSETGNTGFPNVYFSYDKFDRLSEFVSHYSLSLDSNGMVTLRGSSIRLWVKYAYADNNPASMPVRDTVRFFEYPLPINYVGVYEYDRYGRVAKYTTPSNPIDPSRTYDYDANGNLILPNVTYDTMKNYRARNKVFMLIDKNFSVNNPFISPSYNDKGYPLGVPSYNADRFLFQSLFPGEFSYDCSSTGKTD